MTDDAQRRARTVVEQMLPHNPEKWDLVEERGHTMWLSVNRWSEPTLQDYLDHDETTCPLCERIRKRTAHE